MLDQINLGAIMTLKGVTGFGTTIGVRDYKHVYFKVATDGGGDANLTVQFQISTEATAPNFTAAQSVTNFWTYGETLDLNDSSSPNGDTGLAIGVGDEYHTMKLNNAEGIRWVNVELTRTAGEVTVEVFATNDTIMQ